jgi:hypothetical protein
MPKAAMRANAPPTAKSKTRRASPASDSTPLQRAIRRYCRPRALERGLKILEPGLPGLLASISRASLAAIRPQLVGEIAEAADRGLAEDEEGA